MAFKQEIVKGNAKSEESIPSWWNPSRAGLKSAPEWFLRRLEEFDPELKCVWNGFTENWQIFCKSDRIKSPIARGWLLIRRIPPEDLREHNVPLILAALWAQSARRGVTGAEYFDRIMAEQDRDMELAKKAANQETADMMNDYWESTQIGSHRKGSNFSNYLS